jgi:FkbM family methyltransferase
MNADIEVNLRTMNGWAELPSSLKRADGGPRFNLNFPVALAGDQGARHLIANEAAHGYEPPTRNLLERILRRGDVFIDVGAHWGFFTLQAATHPAGEIDVIAFEPELMNATVLTENVTRNKLANVTVVCAACGHRHELAPLVTNSTMGHSIRGVGLPNRSMRGPAKWVSVTPLDDALSNLKQRADRRFILKIDAEGFEPNVIAGARSLLEGGHIALIIWERGDGFAEGAGRAAMVEMTAYLSACGFNHFRPPNYTDDAPLVTFDPQSDYVGNVFSCRPALPLA